MRGLLGIIMLSLVLGLNAASGAVAGEKTELMVSAALSLTNAFTELGAEFEKENPSAKVCFNFGPSGALLSQLASGSPTDVFASADLETMAKAEEKGLIDVKTRKNFAANRLVLAIPVNGRVKIDSANSLLKAEVKRIAIGDPAFVPAGRYAKRYLEVGGLWTQVEPKLITGGNVRQVLDYISRGEVDAGFVYATDAAAKKDSVVVADTLSGAEPVFYPFATLSASRNKSLAAKFQEFALGAEGKAILKKYGFMEP